MTHQVYCLECNALIGEEPERGESDRGDRLDLCQTCAQHRGLEDEAARPAPDPLGDPAG